MCCSKKQKIMCKLDEKTVSKVEGLNTNFGVPYVLDTQPGTVKQLFGMFGPIDEPWSMILLAIIFHL